MIGLFGSGRLLGWPAVALLPLFVLPPGIHRDGLQALLDGKHARAFTHQHHMRCFFHHPSRSRDGVADALEGRDAAAAVPRAHMMQASSCTTPAALGSASQPHRPDGRIGLDYPNALLDGIQV